MGDLSPHFSRAEFACHGEHCCGHSAPISLVLVGGLEVLRGMLSEEIGRDTPVFVMSGFRCVTHDREEARARGETESEVAVRRSRHCVGEAADIVVRGVDGDRVAELAERVAVFREGGIGRYGGERSAVVHLDCRSTGRARWREAG